ncbi:hypothetical protein K435DRAFT_873964 [Dendrothele bispora CBS 962.96]|uniref:Uncharacterized protein n=1 Tax=Dendrothele bispora (strain CBS 962.96) TaxID=1314807 RepID=A0A4S8KYY3_DENBC|nr:hypothetical protein K435DRAFT_873964 [Dendrothele bispora CBS 962.96]
MSILMDLDKNREDPSPGPLLAGTNDTDSFYNHSYSLSPAVLAAAGVWSGCCWCSVWASSIRWSARGRRRRPSVVSSSQSSNGPGGMMSAERLAKEREAYGHHGPSAR